MSMIRLIVVAAVALSVSACSTEAATSPTPSPTSTRSAADRLPPRPERTPTQSPTPSGEPTPTFFTSDGELLFTITATAVNGEGASIALRQQVYAPVEFGDLPTDLQAFYTKTCTPSAIEDHGFLRTAIEVTDTSPAGVSWPTTVGEPVFNYSYILTSTGSSPAYTGAWQGFQAACASVFVLPGHTEGTVAVLRTSDPDEVGGWARMQFGFHPYYDPYIAGTGYVIPVVSNCAIAFEPAAGDFTLARSEAFEDSPASCLFGEDEYFRR